MRVEEVGGESWAKGRGSTIQSVGRGILIQLGKGNKGTTPGGKDEKEENSGKVPKNVIGTQQGRNRWGGWVVNTRKGTRGGKSGGWGGKGKRGGRSKHC